jgi:hypothetical protein
MRIASPALPYPPMRTPSIRRSLLTAAFLFAATATAAAQGLFADVTGKWNVSVNTGGRVTESVVTLKQTGDSISGTIESEATGGARELVGTIKSDTVRFGFSIQMQGNTIEIAAGGLLKDKDTIEGEMALPNGAGTFPFTAKRQQP